MDTHRALLPRPCRRRFLRLAALGLLGLALPPGLASAQDGEMEDENRNEWYGAEWACATCRLWWGDRRFDFAENKVIVDDPDQPGKCIRNYRYNPNDPLSIIYTLPSFLCQFYQQADELY
jgi:hypothetical protein